MMDVEEWLEDLERERFMGATAMALGKFTSKNRDYFTIEQIAAIMACVMVFNHCVDKEEKARVRA